MNITTEGADKLMFHTKKARLQLEQGITLEFDKPTADVVDLIKAYKSVHQGLSGFGVTLMATPEELKNLC